MAPKKSQPQGLKLAQSRLPNARLVAAGKAGQAREDMLDFIERQPSEGGTFRGIFYCIIFLIFVFLFWLRANRDFMAPQVVVKDRPLSGDGPEDDPLRAAAAALRRQFAEQKVADARAEGRELDLEATTHEVEELDVHELTKLVDKQREKILSRCDGGDKEACKNEANALTVSYNQLSAHVEKDFFKVLRLDPSSATPSQIRRAYDEAKANPGISGKELSAIKEARDLLLNPESKTYYLMYGQRPPESMKATSSRHGGWGQEWMVGKWKHAFLEMWMRFFGHSWWAQGLGLLVLLTPMLLNAIPSFYALVNTSYKVQKMLENGGDSDSDED